MKTKIKDISSAIFNEIIIYVTDLTNNPVTVNKSNDVSDTLSIKFSSGNIKILVSGDLLEMKVGHQNAYETATCVKMPLSDPRLLDELKAYIKHLMPLLELPHSIIYPTYLPNSPSTLPTSIQFPGWTHGTYTNGSLYSTSSDYSSPSSTADISSSSVEISAYNSKIQI